MVGFRAVKSGFILSSLPPVYPPYKSWVKKSHQFEPQLISFSLYFYSKWGDGGLPCCEILVYIEFITARLPTLQIMCEKKSSRT
jgi:hypothetical protein